MKNKLPALLALCLLVIAGQARALETDELLAVTAMPLAVADVVALPDVPQNDVMTVVTTLNRAAVPAPQFVEIVRYAPVAIVQPAEPRFVTYVTQQYDNGVVGQPLAMAISDRYDAYGIDDVNIADPPVVTVVERQQILPTVVTTQFRPAQFDPVALIAMPLAVAAVANLTDVPQNDLMQLVASLNRAMVPAPQFVEVVRYSPVVFVDRSYTPQFMQFVTTQVDRGIIGRPLAYAIANRIQTYQPVDIDVVRPPLRIVERDEILPRVVQTRAYDRTRAYDARIASAHPHGGPPGQLKKQLGLQTGAEVVHGAMPNRVARPRVAERHVDHIEHEARPVHVAKPKKVHREHVQHVPPVQRQTIHLKPQRVAPQHETHVRVAPAHSAKPHVAKPHGNGGGHGNGKGKGKGKG